jgi:microcystin-dependent protein
MSNSGIYTWSKTSATNATADSTINWAEGQSPSSVNDSARGMMAVTKGYVDDISGATVTTGTSTAFALATNQAFASLALMNGAMIAFTPNVTCGAGATLNVDGLGAKAINTSPSTAVGAGVLVQGTPYIVTYIHATTEFILHSVYGNNFNIPIGGLMPFIMTTAPNSSFVFPSGQAISRTTYSTLFAGVGTTYGSGDGSTTFNVIDLRGRVPAGVDNMNGSAASRIGSVVTDNGTIVGSTLGSTGGQSTHVQTSGEMAAHSHTFTGDAMAPHTHTHNGAAAYTGNQGGGGSNATGNGAGASTSSDSAGTPTGGNSTSGASTAMAWLQHTIMTNYILRII